MSRTGGIHSSQIMVLGSISLEQMHVHFFVCLTGWIACLLFLRLINCQHHLAASYPTITSGNRCASKSFQNPVRQPAQHMRE